MSGINFNKVKRYSLKNRYSKVSADSVAGLEKFKKSRDYWDLIPDILGGRDLKDLVKSILNAKKLNKPVLLMMGAHPIKCGLSPLIIDLLRQGYITAIAGNGACLVHDFEMAFQGKTSEEVADGLSNGSFGMGKETNQFLNHAAKYAYQKKSGLGHIFGKLLSEGKFKYPHVSIFLEAFRNSVPATVHVAIGTDIYHQHPECSGAAWGESSYKDFHKLCETVSKLGDGGVVINLGSAVIMPEVFLKALNVVRNLGNLVHNFTTANFDMIKQYRPFTNVVTRPVLDGGRGYNFIGQHELLFCTLYYGIVRNKIS